MVKDKMVIRHVNSQVFYLRTEKIEKIIDKADKPGIPLSVYTYMMYKIESSQGDMIFFTEDIAKQLGFTYSEVEQSLEFLKEIKIIGT